MYSPKQPKGFETQCLNLSKKLFKMQRLLLISSMGHLYSDINAVCQIHLIHFQYNPLSRQVLNDSHGIFWGPVILLLSDFPPGYQKSAFLSVRKKVSLDQKL